MTALRRLLSRRVSVEAMLEFLMWLAIPYLLIGLVWAFFDAEQVQLIDSALRTRIPAGSDIGAFLITAAFWPASLLGFDLCVP
ncbi:Uncharacterised protein [Mycolicibacterium phlei]|jgi:hypothetical protein|uniref:Membrane protein n=1 Tax=Mycolicibacterium phlei DSM 43239 = CCUG 21000 TaxID=1226750 RepID=A0A5N5V3X3_MYCPH|nr:hypothetical protein [Mycolicibacterium phlei]VEG08617.1 Uncharacterised protein [Mycobacteroides chelonae]AMO60498.1 hypothetical protein MPHLCCUG_01674 [Mycolicibacterium phlei]EID17620.1 hypothetical protein MPHLEI_02113 [Mycolicibacterium phlei RIVM601174]KAB7756476.1 membrane protein [Mycolicibacterium phlei DSM 43239 = CCUG 21000]KXW61898.1 membrane protein [Mycolicibacterium phlei DSM 43072]